MFAEVVLSRVSKNIDKIYHYSIPSQLAEKISVGSQIFVPFGRRRDVGYVVGFVEKTEFKGIKDIIDVISPAPVFGENAVKLARWMADYYLSFFLTALRLVMPPGIRRFESRKRIAGRRTQEPVLSARLSAIELQKPLSLTEEQSAAFQAIIRAIDANEPEKFLLYGVTGSGKTEIYLQASAHLLQKGKGAIVMVPEISLTPQLIQRFRDRFQDHTAVLHSELTIKQREDGWGRVAAGEARIVLGTRSAIFAPVKDLGLIVIDEEYENTYKSDKSPRYHTREVAMQLAELNKAVVVLGSATPSIETYYKSETKEYKKLDLPRRIDDRPLPPVEIIDMRDEKSSVLSRRLKDEIGQALSNGEQIILFMNRLGYFTFVICRECGLTIECPKCSVSLTYHSSDRKLRCARCGYASEAPVICPRCQSSSIKYFGTGTQRIEEEVAKFFPAARILRYDRDTVSKRGSHEIFFSTFAEGKADILIGTQMVTKGLDVAKVTLVGVVSADTSLSLPDFRAAEHTFQLLTQVAGRAGRRHLPGKVVIQTYNPGNYAIAAAAKHDYEGFYHQEMKFRRELGYPPFSRLISLLVTGREKGQAERTAEDLGKFLRKRLSREVLGPAPAAIARLRGEWRHRILLKGEDPILMRQAVVESLEKAVIPFDVKVAVDVDPMNLL
jgi:primosomal protein N' (replication factor Y)